MKEKTFLNFRNYYIKERGFEGWEQFAETTKIHNPAFFVSTLETIATLYANHVKTIALQEGFEKGCELQKAVCNYHSTIKVALKPDPGDYVVISGQYIQVNKESILNAPDAASPFVNEKKYPIGGFAPGNYTNTCATCNNEFIGDKLARQCEPCAIKMTK